VRLQGLTFGFVFLGSYFERNVGNPEVGPKRACGKFCEDGRVMRKRKRRSGETTGLQIESGTRCVKS